MSQWEAWVYDDGTKMVFPLDDLRGHDTENFSDAGYSLCWCRPLVEEGIHVHNSADGREAFERGERKPS